MTVPYAPIRATDSSSTSQIFGSSPGRNEKEKNRAKIKMVKGILMIDLSYGLVLSTSNSYLLFLQLSFPIYIKEPLVLELNAIPVEGSHYIKIKSSLSTGWCSLRKVVIILNGFRQICEIWHLAPTLQISDYLHNPTKSIVVLEF